MKKILFITHDTSRTGAPFMLLQFLQWLKKNHRGDIKITLLAITGGDLTRDFRKICDEFIELPVEKVYTFKKLEKWLEKTDSLSFFLDGRKRLLKNISRSKFDIIYANTVVSLPIAAYIKSLYNSSELINHVHELKMVIEDRCPEYPKYLNKVDRFIAASELTKKNLIKEYGIEEKFISVIYEVGRNLSIKDNAKLKDEFIIGGSGIQFWRKGVDLFIQVASNINKRFPAKKIKFLWVGGMSLHERKIIENDLEKGKLKETVYFLGDIQDPGDIFSSFDVFLMTSREDPFPLVCIEVGKMGKPVICFSGATGTEEVLINGGGEIVPYLDVKRMATEVISYCHSKEKLLNDSVCAKKIFSEFSVEIIGPQLLNFIFKRF